MNGKAIATTCAMLLIPGAAQAESWAALEEVPIQSGELRLAEPIGREIAFPLERIEIDARVDGPTATILVDQIFQNPHDRTIEAVYVFPLSHEAAVHAYEIQVGGRTIRGEIRERTAARREYEQAKSAGRTAALVEQNKPNVFTQSVANIAPKESVRVRFTYVEQLRFEDGGYELVLPLVVGPRFLPGRTADPEPISGGTHGASGVEVRIGVLLSAGVPIARVESPSHRLDQRLLDGATRAISVSGVAPDRDFVLRWRTAGQRTHVGLLTQREGRGGWFTLIVQPKLSYESSEITGREVIFLIDRSGSMTGIPIARAREIAEALIRSLTPQDTFDVIAFSDRADACVGRPVPANLNNKTDVIACVSRLHPGGGTQLLDGVTRALLKEPKGRRVRHVVVITDGEVGNDDEILNAVAKHGAHNRIFPVGVGAAPNRYLLDRLASGARGFASYVAVDESPARAIDQIVRRTGRPYLTSVEIDWNGLHVDEVEPRVLPDVYAGQPLVVTGRFKQAKRTTIHLLGSVAGSPVDVPLEVDLSRGSEHEGVALFWAKRRIDALLAEDYLRTDARIQKEVTRIGLAHSLVTPYTSFVAIDRDRRATKEAPLLVTQVLDEPANAFQSYAAAPPSPPASYAPPTASEPPRSYGRTRGGGGGDLDPITIMTIVGSLPVAFSLRRRRR